MGTLPIVRRRLTWRSSPGDISDVAACGWAIRSRRCSAARLAARSRSSAAHSRSVSLGGVSCWAAAGSGAAAAVVPASVAGPIVQLRQAASPAPRVPLNVESGGDGAGVAPGASE